MSIFVSDILALIFGNISIIMSIAIEFPQLVTIFKTKNTSGTSLTTYILFLVASFLWVTWSVFNYVGNMLCLPTGISNLVLHIAALVPAILSNVINVVFVSIIFYFKIVHMGKCKKLNISEFEYSKILFDNQKDKKWLRKYWPLFIFAMTGILVCLLIVWLIMWVGIPTQQPQEEFDKKYKWIIFGINIAAAVFFEAVSWPQFIKCMKTKDTSGISMGWAIFLPLSCAVCFSYDLFLALATDYHTVLASLICSGLIINTLVLIIKIRNHLAAKKLGISEWVYTKKYILKKQK